MSLGFKGFAATLEAWNHQIRELAIPSQDYEEDEPSSVKDNANMSLSGIQICAFDSRGVGKSSAPESKSKYTYNFSILLTYPRFY